MSPPLLGNCTAYWQLALMKQQEFPEGNALLTRIITISCCGASGSAKVTHPPVSMCSRTAKAAPCSQTNTTGSHAAMQQDTGIWKPLDNIYFECSNFYNSAAWAMEPQEITIHIFQLGVIILILASLTLLTYT